MSERPTPKKPPLLLIPGLLCDEQVWRPQIEHLANLCEIIVPVAAASTPDGMVAEILNDAPPRFLLAGHSMGGWLALEISKRHPERVLKLCVLATTAEVDSAEKREQRQAMMAQQRRGEFAAVVDALVEAFTHQPHVKPEVRAMLLRNEAAFQNQQNALLTRDSCAESLQWIDAPTTVIVGRDDGLFFDSTLDIAQKIPNAKLNIVDDCGHMLTMEQLQQTTALMRDWISG